MIKIICEDDALVPFKGSEGSAGWDLKLSHDILIHPGETVKVSTGVRVEIPEGFVGIVAPRSSTSDVVLENTIGVIDSDYQGEIFIKLKNVTSTPFLGYKGDRLVQLIVMPCNMDKLMRVETFDTTTARGDKGFGSTNKKAH